MEDKGSSSLSGIHNPRSPRIWRDYREQRQFEHEGAWDVGRWTVVDGGRWTLKCGLAGYVSKVARA